MSLAIRCLAVALLALPMPAEAADFSFIQVAGVGDTMPASSETFTRFDRPSLHERFLAFRGEGTSGEDGVYKIDFGGAGTLLRVADTSTAIPSGAGNFAGFAEFVSVDAERVAFAGEIDFLPTANEGEGIYLDDGLTLSRVYDSTIPVGGVLQGAFPYVSGVSLHGSEIAFGVGITPFLVAIADIGGSVSSRFDDGDLVVDIGTTVSQLGPDIRLSLDSGDVFFRGSYVSGPCTEHRSLFRSGAAATVTLEGDACFQNGQSVFGFSADSGALAWYRTDPLFGVDTIFLDTGSGPVVVVDENTLLPQGSGTLGNFFDVRLSLDAGNVAFHQGLSASRTLFAEIGGELHRVLGPGDTLTARTVDTVAIELEALSGSDIALHVEFTNGDEAIFVATHQSAVPSLAPVARLLLTLGLASGAWVLLPRRRAA